MPSDHLVGGGNNEFLKKIANKNAVGNQVIFHGKLEHDEIFKWLRDIDIYIQPSDTEGLPRSVIEAMSVACPVIGSNAGGIPELINSSAIFDKGNIVVLGNGFQKKSQKTPKQEIKMALKIMEEYQLEQEEKEKKTKKAKK